MTRRRKAPPAEEAAAGPPPPNVPADAVASWRSWATIRARPIQWVWPGRMLMRDVTVLEGRKGVGKSTLATAIAAMVTGGPVLPDCLEFPTSDVVYVAGEEDVDTVTLPRLIAAGGLKERIHDLGIDQATGSPRRLRLPNDLDRLEGLVYSTQARCIVLDPIASCVAPGVNMCDPHAMREIVEQIAALCRRRCCFAVVTRNLRKGTQGPAIDQGMGAGDIGNVARSVLRVDEDPDDKGGRVVSVVACNLGGPKTASLRYGFIEEGDVTRLQWLGHSRFTADELSEAFGDRGERSARADARAFLKEFLSAGEKKVTEIEVAADACGISRGTLRRAREDIGVSTHPRGPNDNRYWVWILPTGSPESN